MQTQSKWIGALSLMAAYASESGRFFQSIMLRLAATRIEMNTAVSLGALRLAKECDGLEPEAYTRAVAAPIDPPAEYDLAVLPEEDCIAAYSLMQWYWREAPTEDGDTHAALYVAKKFGIGFSEAWRRLSNAYGEYNSRYSHN